jgi:hypothetical protein
MKSVKSAALGVAAPFCACLSSPGKAAQEPGKAGNRRTATLTTFDASGAGSGDYQGTYAWSIDAAGVIAGYYFDASFVAHGFVRAATGAFTTFDAASGATWDGEGTYASGINAAG